MLDAASDGVIRALGVSASCSLRSKRVVERGRAILRGVVVLYQLSG